MLVATLVVVEACQGKSTPTTQRAATSEYRVDATVKDIMDAFIDPAADYIWDAVSTTVTPTGSIEKYPRTDAEWKELRRHAIQIMEGTNLLLLPGRRAADSLEGADLRYELPPEKIDARIQQDRAGFSMHAHELYNAMVPVRQAIEAKDKARLLDAADAIDQACENCHLAYWYPPDSRSRSNQQGGSRSTKKNK
jgi:hypothetical protein